MSAFPLLFFGGKLEARYLEGTVTVDGWIRFSAPGKIVALIQVSRLPATLVYTIVHMHPYLRPD